MDVQVKRTQCLSGQSHHLDSEPGVHEALSL